MSSLSKSYNYMRGHFRWIISKNSVTCCLGVGLRDHIDGLVQERPNSIALTHQYVEVSYIFTKITSFQGFVYSVIWLQWGDMAFQNPWHTMTYNLYNLYLFKDEGMSPLMVIQV